MPRGKFSSSDSKDFAFIGRNFPAPGWEKEFRQFLSPLHGIAVAQGDQFADKTRLEQKEARQPPTPFPATDPKQIVRWWGDDGFSNTLHEMEVRPGGVWRHTMYGPDGKDYPNKVVYLEVVEPERLVYSHGDDEGGPACQFRVTVDFEELARGKSELPCKCCLKRRHCGIKPLRPTRLKEVNKP